MPALEKRLNDFSGKNSLAVTGKISKGYSSEIYKAKTCDGKTIAVKIEKDKSPRKDMCRKESENLRLANSVSVGPKLFYSDLEDRAIAMEFIDGITFNKWLFESSPPKAQLKHFLYELFLQAKKLDDIHLSHGQLAGKGKNILVVKRNDIFEPVIIDFEKASCLRKPRNTKQLASLLFTNRHSKMVKKVLSIICK